MRDAELSIAQRMYDRILRQFGPLLVNCIVAFDDCESRCAFAFASELMRAIRLPKQGASRSAEITSDLENALLEGAYDL